MGKIVKMKNKRTGVKVYPVTATKAVVDADSGERLNDTLLQLKNKTETSIKEAPADGQQYVRKNAAWSPISSDETCRIMIESNQGGGDDSSLFGVTVQVIDTGNNALYLDTIWQGQELSCSIPAGNQYKIICGELADYAKPAEKTFEAASFVSRQISMVYNTELVFVTLSSNNGASVVGQTVTINGVEHTWDGISPLKRKIAYGTEYTIFANTKAGYTTPLECKFTASQETRSIELVYENLSYGVFIQGISGKLYSTSEWNENEMVNGVAIHTSKVRIVVSLTDIAGVQWGGYNRLIDGVVATGTAVGSGTSREDDFAGDSNTTKIIETLSGTNDGYCDGAPAAESCRNYKFPNGQNGYLFAGGEWSAISRNLNNVNNALELCGGNPISGTYWQSTQVSARYSWGGEDLMNASYPKTQILRVRPVTSF